MSKINVLVVEDESIVSKDIQHSLKKLGYNVVGASATGEKAIELAGSEKPDIILMDIQLPKMNGYELCKILKSDERTNHKFCRQRRVAGRLVRWAGAGRSDTIGWNKDAS